MDFTIMSIQERLYKLFSTIAVIMITCALIVWCYVSKFNANIVFFASVLYALFLFLIGLYINHTVTRINDHITERAETYNRLISAQKNMELIERGDDPVDQINTFRRITGRREEDIFRRQHNGDKTYFSFWGKFQMPLSVETEKKIDKLEREFLEKNMEICKRIGDIIIQFIQFDNREKSKNQTNDDVDEDCHDADEEYDEGQDDQIDQPQIKKAISFSIKEWSPKNWSVSSQYKKELIRFYSSHNDKHKITRDTKELKRSFKTLEKLYSKCQERIETNIEQIQKVYGKRIDYEAQRFNELSDSMDGLLKVLDDAKEEIRGSISEVYDLVVCCNS